MKEKKKGAEALVECGLCHKGIEHFYAQLVPMHKRCANSLKKKVRRNDESD